MIATSEDILDCMEMARAHIEHEWASLNGRFILITTHFMPTTEVITEGWWNGHVRLQLTVTDMEGRNVGWVSLYRPEEGGNWVVGRLWPNR